MSKVEVQPYTEFILPGGVVSKSDVSRLVKEAERLDNELTAVRVRKGVASGSLAGEKSAKKTLLRKPRTRGKVASQGGEAPAMSAQFTEFLETNKLDLTESKTRTQIVKQLRLLKDKAPVIHMTFATAADPESLQQIITWLRSQVHPQAVISVGLQPALVAGVVMRTTNRIHDFSLRGKLKGSRALLEKELEAARGGK